MTSSRTNKTKLKGDGSALEETRLDQAISSAATATKLPLHCIIRKMMMQKNKKYEKCVILKLYYSNFFLLSGLVIVHRGIFVALKARRFEFLFRIV